MMTLYSFASIRKLWGKLDKINFNGQKSYWYDWANESSGIKVNLIYFDTLFLEVLMGSLAQAILRWPAQNNDDGMILILHHLFLSIVPGKDGTQS